MPSSDHVCRTSGPSGPRGGRGRGRRGGGATGAASGVKPTALDAADAHQPLSDLECGVVGVLGVLGDLDRGLEAALGLHELASSATDMSIVGRADVAVGVGQRVVGGVLEHALGVAELDAGDVDATVGAGVGHDHLRLEGVLAGRPDRVDVGDVVGQRVEPGLVHAQAAVGDAQHVEGAHHRPRRGAR